jgi:capsid protein
MIQGLRPARRQLSVDYPWGHGYGYDAVQPHGRRSAPKNLLWGEDFHLPRLDRRQLIATNRDLQRNFALARWMIGKHLDYVSTFSFHARTQDEALNRRIEELVTWWCSPENFDVAGRHGQKRLTRLLEARAVLDGDVFMLKLADGRTQAIEGDRIAVPFTGAPGFPTGIDMAQYVHGVRTDDAGKVLEYCLCDRGLTGRDLRFNRLLPATHVLQHAYYDRLDQVRGISPMAAAINSLRDVYENIDYALAKAKISQLFGLTFYRDFQTQLEGDDEERTDYNQLDLGRGPFKLELNPGDKAEFLESHTPSAEFKAFMETVIGIVIKCLDIPYSFYDEGHTNFSGSREALLLYEQSSDIKRDNLRMILDGLTSWRMGMFVRAGTLVLPPGLNFLDLKWEWVASGLPWIDPLKEVNADIASVKGFLNSPQNICKSRGDDFFGIVDQIADAKAYVEKKGLDWSGMTFAPAGAADGDGQSREENQ